MANLSAFGGAQPITPGGLVELGYAERTSNYTLVSASSSYTTPFCGTITVVSDGSPLLIEFQSPASAVAAGGSIYINLVIDGSITGVIYQSIDTGSQQNVGIRASRRVVLSAGSHDIAVSAWGSGSPSPSIQAANGGVGSFHPMFLRVSKIVQQNDGLKPFWTPPVVTQLPSNATVGDQVVYAADATNGVYWSLYYDGIGTYPWKFVGGPPLHNSNGSYPGAINSASFVDVPSGANVTAPLDGDYMVDFNGKADCTSSQYGSLNNVAVMTATVAPTAAKAAGVCTYTTSGGYVRASFSRLVNLDGVSAGETIKMQAQAAVGTVNIVYHYTGMSVTPVRVAA